MFTFSKCRNICFPPNRNWKCLDEAWTWGSWPDRRCRWLPDPMTSDWWTSRGRERKSRWRQKSEAKIESNFRRILWCDCIRSYAKPLNEKRQSNDKTSCWVKYILKNSRFGRKCCKIIVSWVSISFFYAKCTFKKGKTAIVNKKNLNLSFIAFWKIDVKIQPPANLIFFIIRPNIFLLFNG